MLNDDHSERDVSAEVFYHRELRHGGAPAAREGRARKVRTKLEASVVPVDVVPEGLDAGALEVLEQLRGGVVEAPDGEAARELTRSLERAIEAGAVGPAGRVRSDATPLRPGRPALRDPVLDEQLRTEGWAKVRVLSREQAAELREAYGEVHGWVGEGFEPDPGNGDVDYRTRSRKVLGAVLDPALAELFVDHSPFLQGYYVKLPGCPETHIHSDWTNVDEEAGHRSYIAWTALQDITDDVGQMSVLPGSHLVDRSPRGSRLNLPLAGAWHGKEEDVWRRMRRVPLEAGEALVFDMASIHASFSNTTEVLRVAAVTCLRPDESDLVYYRAVSGDTVLRYVIDDDFFLEATPAQLVDELPCRLPSAVLEVRTTPESIRRAEELLSSLEPVEEPPEDVLAEQRALTAAVAGRQISAPGDAASPPAAPEPPRADTPRRGVLARVLQRFEHSRSG